VILISLILSYLQNKSCLINNKEIFSIITIIALIYAINIYSFPKIVSDKYISAIILISIAISLITSYCGYQFFDNDRGSGLYYEPSHLAIFIAPFVCYRLLARKIDIISWSIIIISLLTASSSTLYILISLIIISLIIKDHKINSLLLIIFFIIITYGAFDTSELSSRVSGVLDLKPDLNTNLSSIVWLNGWYQALDHLVLSNGFGVGFNNMGCDEYADLGMLNEMVKNINNGSALNVNDGSFLASKIISELGIIGIFFVIIFTFICLKKIYRLFYYDGSQVNMKNEILINSSGAICFLLLLFVRGFGYFLLPTILIFSMIFHKNELNNKNQ
jgi:hypothetical protein